MVLVCTYVLLGGIEGGHAQPDRAVQVRHPIVARQATPLTPACRLLCTYLLYASALLFYPCGPWFSLGPASSGGPRHGGTGEVRLRVGCFGGRRQAVEKPQKPLPPTLLLLVHLSLISNPPCAAPGSRQQAAALTNIIPPHILRPSQDAHSKHPHHHTRPLAPG